MRRDVPVPGGWYGECHPDGSRAVLVTGSHIETHYGRVALPSEQNLLYLRLASDGRIGGIGHDGPVKDRALLYAPSSGTWTDRGLAYGPSAVIFDAAGQFVVRHEAPPSGYRYVEDGTGRLVTAEATYADTSRRIWEWTTHGDVTVGQGGAGPYGDDPCIVLYQGRRYLLQAGRCRRIVFNRAGDALAISMVREDQRDNLCVWLDVQDLRTLQDITDVKPEPPPQPKPKPEPPPMPNIPDSKAVVVAARAKYAALAGRERAYRICNQVAWDLRELGAGLFYKTGENSYADRSSDVLIFKPGGETFDVLGDAEGKADPQWGRTQPTGIGPMSAWRAPVDPASLDAQEPPPVVEPPPIVEPPPPPPPATDAVLTELRQVNQQISALRLELGAALAALKADISQGVKIRF